MNSVRTAAERDIAEVMLCREALDRLQILGTQSSVLRQSSEHLGAKFLIVMEGEDDIGPSKAGERAV